MWEWAPIYLILYTYIYFFPLKFSLMNNICNIYNEMYIFAAKKGKNKTNIYIFFIHFYIKTFLFNNIYIYNLKLWI